MKTLICISSLDGINYHRLIVPFKKLKNEGFDVDFFRNIDDPDKGFVSIDQLDTKILKQYKYIVFNRILSPSFQHKHLFVRLKEAGIKTVMDIDDNWELNKGHFMYKDYYRAGIDKEILFCLKNSTVIIAENDRLAKRIKEATGREAVVVRNAIDEAEKQFDTTDNRHFFRSVAFVGGIAHRRDVMSIIDTVKELQDEGERFSFTVSGYAAGFMEWERLREDVFKTGVECFFEHGNSVFDYAQLYKDKGIIICPVIRNKFNDYKSALKVIEAGWFSKAVICADVPAYGEIKNVLKYKDGKELKEHLLTLLHDRDIQAEMGRRLHDEIVRKFDIKKENEKRKKILC